MGAAPRKHLTRKIKWRRLFCTLPNKIQWGRHHGNISTCHTPTHPSPTLRFSEVHFSQPTPKPSKIDGFVVLFAFFVGLIFLAHDQKIWPGYAGFSRHLLIPRPGLNFPAAGRPNAYILYMIIMAAFHLHIKTESGDILMYFDVVWVSV